jgi:glutamate formiminotransferase
MRRVIECVPNLSDGRRSEILDAAVETARRVPGVSVLDAQADKEHNRSVLTLVGDGGPLTAALLEVFALAVARIDVRAHQGEHPRLGAVDVVPFVPIVGATMDDCVALARTFGQAVAERFGIPVFLYEEAATAPHRRNLEDVRRGQFEGLADKMKDPLWAPDFGPAQPHPSAGATVVGARMPLIAFNINLGTRDIDVARRIAQAIRHTTGGYRYVKATGVLLEDRDLAQVSINMTDYKRTPLHRVFQTVRDEAERYGVAIVGTELLGVVPNDALVDAAEHFLRLDGFERTQILERKISDLE